MSQPRRLTQSTPRLATRERSAASGSTSSFTSLSTSTWKAVRSCCTSRRGFNAALYVAVFRRRPDHAIALDELADAIIERISRRVAGGLDLGVGDDVVALVGILADRRFQIDEFRKLRLDARAEFGLR